MQVPIKLPIGIEDFEKLRTEGFYYVDKTGLIKRLLDNWGEVNLFTRPRRCSDVFLDMAVTAACLTGLP